MAAHQAPLSLGFSKQEEWSWLAIPSPMYACMLRHFSFVQLCATPTRLLCPRESLGKNTGMGCYFLLCKRGRLYNNIILWMQSYKAVRKLTRWFHNKYHSPYVYVKTGYPLQYILRTMFYRYNWKKKSISAPHKSNPCCSRINCIQNIPSKSNKIHILQVVHPTFSRTDHIRSQNKS